MKWHRYGNAANADENNSQNQCGILFPVQEEVSATEADLIARIKTTGKEKNYELIEYLNDVNRDHAEVLVEQNINGRTDTSYIYGAEINGGFDRISLDRFDGSTGYYLYDSRGSVSGITNEEGQVYQSYRYSVTGEITFGAPQYENEYTYNGESYNPNIESQYLRARYYCVVTATFLTEDSYLGNQTEPLTLNRYNYCVSSYLNYTDPSGNEAISEFVKKIGNSISKWWNSLWKADIPQIPEVVPLPINPTPVPTQASKDNDNKTYIERKDEGAETKSNIELCVPNIVGYCDSTMKFIIREEGDPFLRPRINDNGSITIGYGYDFKQEDDPDMFDKYLYVDDNGQIKVKDIMSLEDAEKTIEKAAIQKGIMLGLEQFINGEGQGNSIKALYVNQNQYDALFSYFFSNGQNVFTQEKYEEWKGYGGEYAERAEAREELRRYLIDENGNYDADRIKELFIESKGANIKYDYKTRRSEEAELFISSQ